MPKGIPFDRELFFERLGKRPDIGETEHHFWADFIEMKCVFSKDGIINRDNFVSIIANTDFTITGQIKSASGIDKNDENEQFGNDCFKNLLSRVKSFDEYYPFTIDEKTWTIALKPRLFTKHKYYLFLLFSSCLSLFPEKSRKTFYQGFELLCLYTLRNILPPQAEAHLFGSSNKLLKKRKFPSSLHIFKKLEKLSRELNSEVILAKEQQFSKYDRGDGGLDLIAWLPNGDEQKQTIVYTVQATCQEDWKRKQFEGTAFAWHNILHYSANPLSLLMIPDSIRIASGEFYKGQYISSIVMIDRQRLLYHLNYKKAKGVEKSTFGLMNKLLKLKDPALN